MQPDSSLPPADTNPSADDHLLEELAALTGLFNPEVLWHTEEKLDNLNEQAARAEKTKSQQPAVNPEESTGL